GPRRQLDGGAGGDRRETAQADSQHEAVDTLVGDDQVRAAAQDAQRKAARAGPPPGGDHLVLVARLDEEARGPAHTQGAVERQRLALARRHGASTYSTGGAEYFARPPV